MQSVTHKGVTCIRFDVESDSEEQFVSSLETCVPDVDADGDIDKMSLHLNY